MLETTYISMTKFQNIGIYWHFSHFTKLFMYFCFPGFQQTSLGGNKGSSSNSKAANNFESDDFEEDNWAPITPEKKKTPSKMAEEVRSKKCIFHI